MSRRLILIRHGQTTYNATGRMQGHLDTELSELGYEQARAAGRLLQDQGVSKIVASDLLRARETARVVAEALGVDYLIWQGRIWSLARDSEGWRPYNGGGMHDPDSITGSHADHVHVSVRAGS